MIDSHGRTGHRIAWLTAMLLSTTALAVTGASAPAWAGGGASGGGALGGLDLPTANGFNGNTVNSTGGGGGSGVSGGNGGTGANLEPGGAGGNAPGADGGNGNASSGGGGGAHGDVLALPASLGTLTGGRGGNGGTNIGAGAGGGGGGGYGVVITGMGSVTSSGAITGGDGGNGGSSGTNVGGGGGSGGTGIHFENQGVTLTNTGSIAGGNGGARGSTVGGGGDGLGGQGISGGRLTIINSGEIRGGLSGDGGTRANAISFLIGANVLELRSGSSIIGNVERVGVGGSATLVLGGTDNSSFDTALIGTQYLNFTAFQKTGTSTWSLAGAPAAATAWTISGGLIAFASPGVFGSGPITLNGGGLVWAAGNTADISARLAPLGPGGGTFDTNSNNVTLASAITGAGGLVKQGTGTLTLAGANSYGGGTVVSAGTLAGNTASLQGNILNNAAVVFDQAMAGTYAGTMFGTGSLTLQGSGLLNLTAANTYTGPTSVLGGTLAVNGSITSNVTVSQAGTLGGTGTIVGTVTNAGTLAPGNSIGTLTVNGSYTQAAGSIYQVEVNAAGQGDRINVTGAPGTATINGGAVQVLAQQGSYGASTTYTIVNATGGVSGTYTGVTSNFAFLTPSLAYDANNVYLILALEPGGFSGGAVTPNEKAVGAALDTAFATASGDFAVVLGTIAGLDSAQGPLALAAISGQQYADFGTMNTNNSAMFMNAIGQQMATARSAASTGTRQALAQACDIAACDAAGPWSAWASALGGLGSVLGDGNAGTLTYNFGGAAAGLDYRIDPRFLVGLGAGYTAGNLWVDGFTGKGWTDSVAVAAYGSFTQAGFYADALAGYAYFNNQLQRQIAIPGLQQRTANGSTGANQFLGQVETGYKLGVYAPALASVTPLGRVQVSSVTQNAFTEWGAQSLNLTVAQQTTNALRTTLGAELAGSIGLGDTRSLDLALRLGWQHEFAYTGRPITAALAGAPFAAFTVYGATPQRDSAVIGFQARTAIAEATQLYLRYDGEIGGGTDNHAVNIGVRLTW